MSILIFLIILSLLVIVHELGHFFAARIFGIRVDEFGVGYPPKAMKLFKWKDTLFTLNWLPFGGFVKIFGESGEEGEGSLQSKSRWKQAVVLVSGVVGNFVFAWLILSIGFMFGLPAPAGLSFGGEKSNVVISSVLPGSPADRVGIRSGDKIISLERGGENIEAHTPGRVSDFISSSDLPLTLHIDRGGFKESFEVMPSEAVVEGRKVVGISMDVVNVVKLGPLGALAAGLHTAWVITYLTFFALVDFIREAFLGVADFSTVVGPVGLVGMVGSASELGLGYLILFTALISLNLTIINLLPFPALDGGRLLFVIIESVIRRPIPTKFANALNATGFAFLILLMVLVTIQDLRNII